MSSWPPRKFEEFEVLDLLGAGGMGTVWRARDALLDRFVAAKFTAEPNPTDQDRKRFLLEGRALARVDHPNVIKVFRIGEVGAGAYMIYELLDGQPLDALSVPVPRGLVIRIGMGLCKGLAAVHAAGILHRDVKPSNAMLVDRESGFVKLLDFGVAKFIDGFGTVPDGGSSLRNLTESGKIVGT